MYKWWGRTFYIPESRRGILVMPCLFVCQSISVQVFHFCGLMQKTLQMGIEKFTQVLPVAYGGGHYFWATYIKGPSPMRTCPGISFSCCNSLTIWLGNRELYTSLILGPLRFRIVFMSDGSRFNVAKKLVQVFLAHLSTICPRGADRVVWWPSSVMHRQQFL